MSTFGYETPGGSDQALAADEHFVNFKSCGFTGVLYSMSAYIKNAASGTEWFRYSIYSDNAGAPDVLLAQTVLIVGTGADGWYSAELSQPFAVTSGTDYWLGVHTDAPITLVYDAGADDSRIISDAWPYPLEPWAGGSDVAREYSIYASTEKITSTRRWTGYKGGMFKTTVPNYDKNSAPADNMLLTDVIAAENLTIESIWAFVEAAWTSSNWMRAVVYSDNAGSPDALLKQSDPIQGASTEQWYQAVLQSTLDITAGTTYWIGFQADSSLAFVQMAWGWFDSRNYYVAIDTYAGGPADPCNAADYTGTGESAFYAEAIADVVETEAQTGIMIDML